VEFSEIREGKNWSGWFAMTFEGSWVEDGEGMEWRLWRFEE
jgi:hypothetical protein